MSDLSARLDGLSPAKRRVLELQLRRKGLSLPQKRIIPRRTTSGPCPLSFAQQRIWFYQKLEPDVRAYNMPKLFKVSGVLERKALEAALYGLVARHEVLRTQIHDLDGEPAQVVADEWSIELPLFDLRGMPDEHRETEAQRRILEESYRPFDLSHDLMIRAAVFRRTDSEYLLLLTTITSPVTIGQRASFFESWRPSTMLRSAASPQNCLSCRSSMPTMQCGNASNCTTVLSITIWRTGASNFVTSPRCFNCRSLVCLPLIVRT